VKGALPVLVQFEGHGQFVPKGHALVEQEFVGPTSERGRMMPEDCKTVNAGGFRADIIEIPVQSAGKSRGPGCPSPGRTRESQIGTPPHMACPAPKQACHTQVALWLIHQTSQSPPASRPSHVLHRSRPGLRPGASTLTTTKGPAAANLGDGAMREVLKRVFFHGNILARRGKSLGRRGY